MGAPVAVAAALAKTRTGRRIAIGMVVLFLLVTGLVLTPLFAIPFAIAGQAVSSQVGAYPSPGANGAWGYPLAGDYFKGRGFGYNPVHGCSFCSTNHKGYDMSQGCGKPVYAAGPGRVVHASALGGWGNAVRIDHGDNLFTLYAHMNWGSIAVAEGQQVSAGSVLGTQGNTGNSFGCHLHFEVQEGWAAIPPEPFMAARGLPLK